MLIKFFFFLILFLAKNICELDMIIIFQGRKDIFDESVSFDHCHVVTDLNFSHHFLDRYILIS